MEFPHEIFKAYDIRGIVDRTLTEAMVRRIGQALGSEARGKGAGAVVLGRDGRLSGERLSGALVAGLRSAGCDVIDIGQVPTPALYFATREFGTGTGVQVTGSHNPPQYNGLKMMIEGVTLSGEAIQGIKQRVLDGNVLDGHGSYAKGDILDTYCGRILDDVH
ncbi:MAG: phosphomannomutase/phosphoglucomutase, partial [Gammaproteobacteria bacterium]|nr:phosphomannomutase/phosphoglucomutase [Gammaproteobacteria bacterium]